MADGMNKAILCGNCGSDGELRHVGNDQSVLQWRMATTTSYFSKVKNERVEDTQWHTIVLWGKRADALAQYVTKGKRLLVEGEIKTREYEDKEGAKRRVTEIHASEVILLGDGRGDSDGARGTAGRPAARATGGGTRATTAAAPQRPADDFGGPVDDTDAPF